MELVRWVEHRIFAWTHQSQEFVQEPDALFSAARRQAPHDGVTKMPCEHFGLFRVPHRPGLHLQPVREFG